MNVKTFIERCRHFTCQVLSDRHETAFIRHNRAIWREDRSTTTDGEILIEVNPMASSIIAYSYLANVLARIHRSVVTGYLLKKKSSRELLLDAKLKKIYRSFNTDRFFYLDLDPGQFQERNRLFQEIHPRLNSKRDVEDLTVDGVWFGDLLYDAHLMAYQVPTIDLEDARFAESLRDALGYYIFWRDYLRSHEVKAVILSHCVYYRYAILLRLAVRHDIPVYQCGASHLYRLNKDRLWAYDDFYDYPEQFHKLSLERQEKGLQLALERLRRRFSGEVGVDMHYSTMSSYTSPRGDRIIPESPRIKILIATHCFFDSPHPYGVNLFPDFYEWLTFLGQISERTDYDWYIKTHPDFLPGNKEILEKFIKRFPKFHMIPSVSSHLQLIEDGIDIALTVYGTIGFEYAALGKPVVNASLCNPHIRYDFNIHPKSVSEYEQILLNLSQQKLEIDIRKVYEYYYMAHLHHTDNWLFEDFRGLLKSIGGYNEQFSPVIYKKFLEEFSGRRHEKIQDALSDFILSKEYLYDDNASDV